MSDTKLDDRRPFTRADAVRAGVPARVLRTSRYRRLFRDVYVRTDSTDEFARPRGALSLHPGSAFLSHHSAARIYGLPIPHDPDEHVTVLAAADRRHRLGITCHVTTEEEPAVITRHGMRVSHLFRMFLELAGVLDLVDLVVVGDAIARMYGIEPRELQDACAAYAHAGRHHAWAAGRAAHYVRSGVDSPMETRLRMLIVLAGLPEPVVNHQLRDADGHVRRRLDLSYPGIRLIIEYDGRQHAEDIGQWGHDLERREELDDDGWRLLVVRSDGIFRHPEHTLLRIRRQLMLRGWENVPALTDDWRVYFPSRP